MTEVFTPCRCLLAYQPRPNGLRTRLTRMQAASPRCGLRDVSAVLFVASLCVRSPLVRCSCGVVIR